MKYGKLAMGAVGLIAVGLVVRMNVADTVGTQRSAPLNIVPAPRFPVPAPAATQESGRLRVQPHHDPVQLAPPPKSSRLPEPAAQILSELLKDPIPAPSPFKGEAELNPIFEQEKQTAQSVQVSASLRAVLNDIPGMDMKLIDQSLECRETLCRLVGGIDPAASTEDAVSAIREVQRIKPEQLDRAGILQRLTIKFRGANFLAYYRIKPPR